MSWVPVDEAIAQIDAGSGQPVGRRRHSPITITREVDVASPKLFQVLVTNEVFKAADSVRGRRRPWREA